MKCPYCDNGVVYVLVNSSGFYFEAEEPIEEENPCEECGGTGELEDEL